MKPFLPFSWALVTWPPKKHFSPITPQGCIFTLRHAGWFGISAKKYVQPYAPTSEILKYKDFWKFLGEWFSICGGLNTLHLILGPPRFWYQSCGTFLKFLLKFQKSWNFVGPNLERSGVWCFTVTVIYCILLPLMESMEMACEIFQWLKKFLTSVFRQSELRF